MLETKNATDRHNADAVAFDNQCDDSLIFSPPLKMQFCLDTSLVNYCQSADSFNPDLEALLRDLSQACKPANWAIHLLQLNDFLLQSCIFPDPRSACLGPTPRS